MKNVKSPSPLAPRICACGCGHEFQPTRKDKVYLNSIHADNGYNKFKRRKRDPNSDKLIKLLRGNDSILRFFYEKGRGKSNQIRLSSLLDAGLKTSVFVGKYEDGGYMYNCMYNFRYRILTKGEVDFVEIKRLIIS